MPEGYISGVVESSHGPETGVWVIAETDELETKFIKIVVTDDRGRFVLPELPEATYDVWVRGYGLVDSEKVKLSPDRDGVNLTAVVAPTPAGLRQVERRRLGLVGGRPADREGPHPVPRPVQPALVEVLLALLQQDIGRLVGRGGTCHDEAEEPKRQDPAEDSRGHGHDSLVQQAPGRSEAFSPVKRP